MGLFFFSHVERGLFDIRKRANAGETLAWGSRGGTAVSRFEGLPVWAFQLEWLLLSVGLLKWRECVQSGTAGKIQISAVVFVCSCQ